MAMRGWKFFRPESVKRKTEMAQKVAIFNTLVAIMRVAIPRVPTRTWRLLDSGEIKMDPDPTRERGWISFGGKRVRNARTWYAIIVHETDPNGRNFLREPFAQMAESTYRRELANSMRARGL